MKKFKFYFLSLLLTTQLVAFEEFLVSDIRIIGLQRVSTGRPAGWHFMNEFVDKDGNVFHKGKEQPDLKGTLPPTKVKPRKKKKKLTADQKLFKKAAEHKKRLKVPFILVRIKFFGPSIDLSTCVSAAKLKITSGLYFFNISINLFLFMISTLISL